MAGRPRCVVCKRAFTPDARNRTKTDHRQRVCKKCGPVMGHRVSQKRYEADPGRFARKKPPPRLTSRGPEERPALAVPVSTVDDLANLIQVNCRGLAAALLTAPAT